MYAFLVIMYGPIYGPTCRPIYGPISATALCAQCVQVPTIIPQLWSLPRSSVLCIEY